MICNKLNQNRANVFCDNHVILFKDFPDFPIFEKSIFHDEAWAQMEIDFEILMVDIMSSNEIIEKLHSLLKEEFQAMDSPEERSEYLCNRKGQTRKILARFEELTDPSYVALKGKEDEIDQEAYSLHLMIKYDIEQISPLEEFFELREALVLHAIALQGYIVDTCVGEITRVPTVEFSPEIHP